MDLDGDGRRDVLTGSWPGRIYWYQATKTGFARGRSLRHRDGSEVNTGNASAPFAADWDGDGDLDLLIGNIQGHVKILERVDGEGGPVFGKPARVQVGGKALDVRNDAGPVMADWDRDGRLDLIVADGYGGVQWFRNTAKKGVTVLAAPRTLIDKPSRTRARGARPGRGSRAKVCVTDWNEDGQLDLLVGEFGTDSRPRTRKAPPSSSKPNRREPIREEPSRKELSETKKALSKLIVAADRAQPGEDAEAREARLARRDALCTEWVQLDQKSSMMAANWLGRVWLYQRKAATTESSPAAAPGGKVRDRDRRP